jgi:peroxiredoxin
MKKLLLPIITLLILAACSRPENEFRLSGSIDDAAPGWIVFSKAMDNKLVPVDSVNSQNGEFTFSGTIDLPEMFYLKFKEDDVTHRIFIAPGNISVTGTLEEPEVSGSEAHDIYQRYVTEMMSFDGRRQDLYDEFRVASNEGDEEKMQKIREKVEELDYEQEHLIDNFIVAQKDNVVGPYLLISNVYQYELEKLIEKRELFASSLAASKYVQRLDKQIAKLQSVEIGKVAPLFTQNDPEGNPVALDNLRGKYLLVDFWASWCGPCRRENPNIVAAWQKYHDKGFDVLGVSLDRNRADWLKAIEDDNLTWTHVSDLKFWSNEASTLYGINSIPASFLLDPEGVIVAKDLREEALHQKLEEIFGE